jgi:hypothetical protein
VDTLADTAQAIRSQLRPGEVEALGRTALAAGASDRQRAGAIGVLRILAADNEARVAGTAPSSSSWQYDRGRPAGTSTPATPAPASDPAMFARLAAEVCAVAEEARHAAEDLAVFGIATGPASPTGPAHLSAEEARYAAEDLAVFGLDTRPEALR